MLDVRTEKLQSFILEKNKSAILELIGEEHPADIAEICSELEPEEIHFILSILPGDLNAEVFSYLDIDFQAELASLFTREELARLFSTLSPDDRATSFREMPEHIQEIILPALAFAEREDIRKLSQYPENSAGSVMTSDYVALSENITVEQALKTLRLEAPDKETIYYCYITNQKRELTGFVSLKDIILASPNQNIRDIMDDDVISVNITDDKEDVARKIQKYDLLAIPVINGGNTLVGIITHDDAIDILTEEQTEDIEKIMAISGEHLAGGYLRTPAWYHFKKRVGWVVILAIMGLLSGYIIHSFESALTGMIILAIYMPMMADTGGNTGSQSASMVIRALALKEIRTGDFWRVISKEFFISAMLAVILGLLAFMKVWLITSNTEIPVGFSLPLVGFAIAGALALQVVSSTLIGALLPLIASKFKLDPAVVASPALTTVVDITGLLIYFYIMKIAFGL